jgi:hypothetical protein
MARSLKLLKLHQVSLEAPLNQTGQCLILAELILPRKGIARKAALKDLSLSKGKRSFARAPFYETALFKEKVDGRFGIKLSVSRPLKNPELNQFLKRLLATSVESASNLIQPSFIKDLVDEASDQLGDRILDDESFIACGGLELDSESLASGKITLALKLTETIRKSDLPPGPRDREKGRRQRKSYRKGSTVGEVSLDLSID